MLMVTTARSTRHHSTATRTEPLRFVTRYPPLFSPDRPGASPPLCSALPVLELVLEARAARFKYTTVRK
jgi:hypothetical protein